VADFSPESVAEFIGMRRLNNKTREELVALQQKAQRELRQYEDALRIVTAVFSERGQ